MSRLIVAGFTFVATLMLFDRGPGLNVVQILIATACAIVATIVYGWVRSQRGS